MPWLYLHAIGIQPGDRVAGNINSPEAVVNTCMRRWWGGLRLRPLSLAWTHWKRASAGSRAIIACNGYAHGGKTYDSRIKVNNCWVIPSIEHIILYEESPELDLELYVEIPAVTFDAATSCAPDATFERPTFDLTTLYISTHQERQVSPNASFTGQAAPFTACEEHGGMVTSVHMTSFSILRRVDG